MKNGINVKEAKKKTKKTHSHQSLAVNCMDLICGCVLHRRLFADVSQVFVYTCCNQYSYSLNESPITNDEHQIVPQDATKECKRKSNG